MTTKAGFWIGALLLVGAIAGALGFGGLSFVGLGDEIDGFQRVPAPGQGTVRLDARKYVVYVEGTDGDERTPAVEITISDPRTQRPLPLGGYSGSLTYSLSGHAGAARATVTPPSAGTYLVRVATSGGDAAATVAIGPSIAGRLVRTILGTLAIGGVLGIAGLVLLIATAVRRSSAKERAMRAGLEG